MEIAEAKQNVFLVLNIESAAETEKTNSVSNLEAKSNR